MISCWDVAVCGACGIIMVFPACFCVVVCSSAVCAKDSFSAVHSHVTLFSTFEASGPVSIV